MKENLTAEGLDSLIKLFMPLSHNMAKKFCRRKDMKDYEEYTCVGNLGLVEGVHNAFKYMKHDNLIGYLVLYIRRKMLRYWREDRTVKISDDTQARWFKLGYLYHVVVRPLEQEDVSLIESNDLLDALMEVIPDLLHRQVLTLRLERHTDKEIAVLLNLEPKEIKSVRAKLKVLLSEILSDDLDE